MSKKNPKNVDSSKSNPNIKLGIGKTLMVILLPVISIGMVAIIVGLNLQAAKCLTEISKIDLQAETEKNAITLGSPFEKLVSTYDDYAYTLENIPFNSTEEIMKYLKPSTENQPIKNTGIYLGFPDGRAVFADGTVVPSDIDVTTRSWYQKAMADKDKNFIVSEVYKDSLSDELCVTYSRRVDLHNGSTVVLGVDIFLNDLKDEVSGLTPMKTGSSIVLSKDQLIVFTDSELNGSLISDIKDSYIKTLYDFAWSDSDEVNEINNGTGHSIYTAKYEVPGTGWMILSTVSEKYILAKVIKFRNIAIAFMLIILSIITIVLIFTVQNIIAKPIKLLSNSIIHVSEGDFTVNMPKAANNEIGLISSAMKNYVDRMKNIIKNIQIQTNQLTNDSHSSKDSSIYMASQGNNQSISMSEIQKAIDGISKDVLELAQNASNLAQSMDELTEKGQRTNKIMLTLVEQADSGQHDMSAVEEKMVHINESMTEMNEVVNIVSESADKINEILSMIDSIAEQTNLLSLNASIEAARAGEAGKGFAVVAGEIGNLASNSQNAAKEITAIVSKINAEITKLSEQSQINMAAISESSSTVKSAGDNFHKIFDDLDTAANTMNDMIGMMSRVNNIASSVAAISEEQSASTEEVMATVTTLTQSAEDIATTTKNVEKLAISLSDSAVRINDSLSTFKIE